MQAFQGGQNDDRRRVLDATDIVRLVADHVALKAKGREYVGLCPFHNDRNPSMYVVPSKQIFHCFVCGAGGSSIDFVMRHHGMSYGEALRYLADRAGLELTPWKPVRRAGGVGGSGGSEGSGLGGDEDVADEVGVSREALAGANRFALEFFRAILRHPEHGASARAVVQQRGIAPEIAERFQIGAAPDRWDGLLKTVEARGLDVGPFVAAGLLKPRDSGGLYDALRNRLIFPILDQLGRPIAFGGRKIKPEDEPKYLNSPETDLFKKGSTLFALPQAYKAIQHERCAIITEGYTDAMACHQAGFENVVATLGTALTARHASVLRRICDRVVLLFDADEAGQNAADRALEVFFKETLDVQVMSLPGGKDPDEVLKTENGADVFRAQLAAAQDMLEFRFARKAAELRSRGGMPGSAAHTRMVEEDLARLLELGLNEVSPIRRHAIVKRYAAMVNVPERTILETLERRRGPVSRVVAEAQDGPVVATSPTSPRSAGEEVIACVLARPALVRGREEEIVSAIESVLETGPEPALESVGRWVLGSLRAGSPAELSELMRSVEDPSASQLAACFARTAETRVDGVDADLAAALDDALKRLASRRAQRSIDALSDAVGASRPSGPDGGTDHLEKLLELRRKAQEDAVPLLTMPRPNAAFIRRSPPNPTTS
ncbi:MAG: DNA primase [Phycisphaerales bacterium]